MTILIKYKLIFIGIITGAIGGYLYYNFVGCTSGTCAITSRPVNSSLYGAMMGALFFDFFRKEEKSEKD